MTAKLDVALALRQVGEVAVADSTPILGLGAVLILLPALASAVMVPGHSLGTVLAVTGGLGAALFVTLVSHGTAQRLAGAPLAPNHYFRRSIVASPPGFNVALLLGAAGVVAAILVLLTGLGSLAAATIIAVNIAAAVWMLPALPLALTERCPPLVALRRAMLLTRGSRGRIAVLFGLAALTFGPLALLIGGPGTGGLASGRLWLWLLFELLAAGVLATLPSVVYGQLARRSC